MNYIPRNLGTTLAVALPLAVIPPATALLSANKKKKELLARKKILQEETIPKALLAGGGSALLSGMTAYNIVSSKSNKENNKYSNYTSYSRVCNNVKNAFLGNIHNLFAFSKIGGGILAGVLIGAPIGAASYYFAKKKLTPKLEEGESKLRFLENNLIPLAIGAGTAAGFTTGALVARKRLDSNKNKYMPNDDFGYYGRQYFGMEDFNA